MSSEASTLPNVTRFITTHDSSGKSVFSSSPSEDAAIQLIPGGGAMSLVYATNQFPTSTNGDQDLITYQNYIENDPGLSIATGTVCRVVDIAPGVTSPMHRTVSLDYIVILDGEMELTLDSGESRCLKRGEIAIQRGTNHSWKNVSPDGGWARMFCVLSPVEPVVAPGGETLGDTWSEHERAGK